MITTIRLPLGSFGRWFGVLTPWPSRKPETLLQSSGAPPPPSPECRALLPPVNVFFTLLGLYRSTIHTLFQSSIQLQSLVDSTSDLHSRQLSSVFLGLRFVIDLTAYESNHPTRPSLETPSVRDPLTVPATCDPAVELSLVWAQPRVRHPLCRRCTLTSGNPDQANSPMGPESLPRSLGFLLSTLPT